MITANRPKFTVQNKDRTWIIRIRDNETPAVTVSSSQLFSSDWGGGGGLEEIRQEKFAHNWKVVITWGWFGHLVPEHGLKGGESTKSHFLKFWRM
jgi:hypothetical protein